MSELSMSILNVYAFLNCPSRANSRGHETKQYLDKFLPEQNHFWTKQFLKADAPRRDLSPRRPINIPTNAPLSPCFCCLLSPCFYRLLLFLLSTRTINFVADVKIVIHDNSWWQFSFQFRTKWKSIWFKIEKKTIITIVFLLSSRTINLRWIASFGIIFHYFYICRHVFRPIGTHQYNQKLPKISLKLNDSEILI